MNHLVSIKSSSYDYFKLLAYQHFQILISLKSTNYRTENARSLTSIDLKIEARIQYWPNLLWAVTSQPMNIKQRFLLQWAWYVWVMSWFSVFLYFQYIIVFNYANIFAFSPPPPLSSPNTEKGHCIYLVFNLVFQMIFRVQPKFAYFAVLGLLEMMITLSFSVSSKVQSQSREAKFPCVLWKYSIFATYYF